MSLRLSSFSSFSSLGPVGALAATLVLLAACTTPMVIANSTGGSGGSSSSAGTTSGTGASGCDGGECHCTGGIPPTCNLDSDCGPACYGLVCAAHECAPVVCTPGMDQTCNENAAMNALAGACNPNGTCTCKAGFTLEASGKCG